MVRKPSNSRGPQFPVATIRVRIGHLPRKNRCDWCVRPTPCYTNRQRHRSTSENGRTPVENTWYPLKIPHAVGVRALEPCTACRSCAASYKQSAAITVKCSKNRAAGFTAKARWICSLEHFATLWQLVNQNGRSEHFCGG